MDETWREHAACTGADPNLFFTIGDYITTEAAQLCHDCPAREACLDYALRCGPELQGTWAGTTQRQRRYLRRRARKAAS